jgi:hypothetical protein
LSITENEFVYNEKENRWLSRSGYKAAKTMNSIKTSAMGAYGEASKFVNKAMEDPKGTANKALNKTEDATRKAISGIRGFIDRISN